MERPRPAANPPLSIGLMTPGWPAHAFPNGIVTYVATLLPPLRRMGHRVSLLAGQLAGAPGEPGIYDLSAYRSRRSLTERLADAVAWRMAPDSAQRRMRRRAFERCARRMASDERLHILEMEESFGAAAWVREAIPIPVCVRLHGPWFLNGPVRGARDDAAFRARVRAEGEAIAAADGVTAPTREVLERVRAHYGLALPHAEVIPYPVAPVPAEARWRLETCDAARVLFVGRFDRHKGGDLVVDAFARILEEVPRARLCFVGPDRGCVDGGGRTWSLPDYVRHRLPGALEAGRLEWLGQKPPEALAPLRRGALVTVVASRYETFCYAAAEAAALGCPLVATRVGAIPELVRNGENGLLCRPEPEDLADKVLSLLRDPPRAAALGARAAFDRERLDHPVAVAARVTDFYGRVLARGRSGREPGSVRAADHPAAARLAGGSTWPKR